MLEEIARNYNIVLQWRINKIASWMSLMSSEKTFVPETSVQYWNLLFSSPPAAKQAYHRASDQWIHCGNWPWRFAFNLQKWTAPSSSRCTYCEWQRRNVTVFDTSKSEKEYYFPGSKSIQFLLPLETILVDELEESSLWFCFGLWSACKILCIHF